MAAHGVRFHATDIWDAPENEKRYEVIDGELYVTPPPIWAHQFQLGNLYTIVNVWVRSHRLGYMATAPTGVILDGENGIQPDFLYVSRERAHIIKHGGVEGAPDLVAEALSPSTESRDRGIKLRRYAAAGVTHYWILDTEGPRIEERVLGEDGYRLVGTFGPGEVFRPTIFPGLEIPLDDIAD
jgi:Uma2 family endonuclease